MKELALVHSFFSVGDRWFALVEDRRSAIPVTPEPPQPPEPQEDPGEPDREYPFWTCFIDNPRPKS